MINCYGHPMLSVDYNGHVAKLLPLQPRSSVSLYDRRNKPLHGLQRIHSKKYDKS